MPIIKSNYTPVRWLRNPHLQTIIGSKLFKPALVQTRSERIELPDGDFIDINFGLQSKGDLVAIFHGLAGGIQSSYVQGAIQALQNAGFRPVLMHWRGCSGEPNRLPRAYHSGASDDIQWFINYLHERFADTPIHAVGYSLGANALLKYLGETGEQSGLVGAMAVSPPLVLKEGAKRLDSGFARLYQFHLLHLLRQQHEHKRRCYPELNLQAATSALNNFWKFDDAITAPLHGYNGVHDYYSRCSARPYLATIRTPTRILCAKDDPFFTPSIIPGENELSATTTLELSATGGHVGFLQGSQRWLDEHVAQVLRHFRSTAEKYSSVH